MSITWASPSRTNSSLATASTSLSVIATSRSSASWSELEMSKRLALLEKMTSEGTADPFAWYGLALEYRNLERWDDALRTFEALRAKWPDYVPTYLMAAQMLEQCARAEE